MLQSATHPGSPAKRSVRTCTTPGASGTILLQRGRNLLMARQLEAWWLLPSDLLVGIVVRGKQRGRWVTSKRSHEGTVGNL